MSTASWASSIVSWAWPAPPPQQEDFVFPTSFLLPDLLSIISLVFAYDTSKHESSGRQAGRDWMYHHKPMSDVKIDRFLDKGNFARFASMSFPQADKESFATAYEFYLWAFLTDDTWDEGGLRPEFTADDVQAQVQACWDVLEYENPADAIPTHPFASMLQSILVNMSKTATPGACKRFANAVRAWSGENVEQCKRRSLSQFPSVEEYINIRRKTIGQGTVEAILEYVVQAHIPDHVFEHPIMIEISQVTTDILTWPNDLCSFNKEQADGDYQNFVCILMRERGLDLQTAVNTLVEMIAERVQRYDSLKKSLPSFGATVDKEVARYLAELEHETYGSVRWYYESPRYWRGHVDIHQDLHIEVFAKSRT